MSTQLLDTIEPTVRGMIWSAAYHHSIHLHFACFHVSTLDILCHFNLILSHGDHW